MMKSGSALLAFGVSLLLCAPAGYGKTTLAREWVATRSEPVYWYSGGPAMADVAALTGDSALATRWTGTPRGLAADNVIDPAPFHRAAR